ncbi:MAG: glutaredoxin domain-containing protein [Candidatus Melainabacteria bacterium]|nr:glutaredoxin domain-containing protein [Candidatus Melainabacteria bacterium]
MSESVTTHPLEQEIEQEIRAHKIMIYSKGTQEFPRCGFTMETAQFFSQLNVPFTMQDVLDNPEKRQYLSEKTDWPTLPKVFINGQFFGDTDILSEMLQTGELHTVLKEAFGDAYQQPSAS